MEKKHVINLFRRRWTLNDLNRTRIHICQSISGECRVFFGKFSVWVGGDFRVLTSLGEIYRATDYVEGHISLGSPAGHPPAPRLHRTTARPQASPQPSPQAGNQPQKKRAIRPPSLTLTTYKFPRRSQTMSLFFFVEMTPDIVLKT